MPSDASHTSCLRALRHFTVSHNRRSSRRISATFRQRSAADSSQKTANPPHRGLMGIMLASPSRKTTPGFGVHPELLLTTIERELLRNCRH